MLAVRVDVELDDAAVGAADLLLREVDRQRGVGAALGVVEQLLQVLGRDLDRQHAVLEAVVVEDVAERGRDHAADAEIHQRPGRVLARRAAAEIVACDQDLGLAIGRLVEDEIGVLAAVVAVAFLREQALAEAGRLIVLRYCLGMIASVSTLIDFIGAATPSSTVNLSMVRTPCRMILRLGHSALCPWVKSLKDRYFLYSYRRYHRGRNAFAGRRIRL